MFLLIFLQSVQLHMKAPSGDFLPARGAAKVTQMVVLNNPNKVNLKMRVRISYTSQGSAFQDTVQIDSFPGLSAGGHWHWAFGQTTLWKQSVNESSGIALHWQKGLFPLFCSPSSCVVGCFYGWRKQLSHRKSQPRTWTDIVSISSGNQA